MLDKFKSLALEGYIKNKFPEYLENGEISVDLKTSEARCSFTARLAGEASPVSIEVKHYDVAEKNGEKFLRVTEVSSDRKWLENLLRQFLQNRDIKLPSFMADAL